MSSWSTTGFLVKFVINICNGTIEKASFMSCAKSVQYVGLTVRTSSLVIRPQLDFGKTTGDFVLALIVMSIATKLVACPFCYFIEASYNNIYVNLDSVRTPSKRKWCLMLRY